MLMLMAAQCRILEAKGRRDATVACRVSQERRIDVRMLGVVTGTAIAAHSGALARAAGTLRCRPLSAMAKSAEPCILQGAACCTLVGEDTVEGLAAIIFGMDSVTISAWPRSQPDADFT